MVHTTTYGWLSIIIVLLFEGAVFYVIDKHLGVRIYKWWYGLTHKDPYPPGAQEYGCMCIYSRRAHMRFSAATSIALMQNGILFWSGVVNPIPLILSIPIEVVLLMAGFYAGPLLNRLWERKDPLLEIVDKIDKGETTVLSEVKKAADSVRDSFTSATRMNSENSESVENVKDKSSPKKQEDDEIDSLKLMRQFTRRERDHGS